MSPLNVTTKPDSAAVDPTSPPSGSPAGPSPQAPVRPVSGQQTGSASGQQTGSASGQQTGSASGPPAIRLRGAQLAYGPRVLWDELDLDVARGEFIAVLGPNGSGKTSLLRVLLGLAPLSAGSAQIDGRPVRRGPVRRAGGTRHRVGYIPQQRAVDPTLTLRGRDLVGLGLDGHRWGFALPSAQRRARVLEALRAVGAQDYADAPVGLLSGGEQQRLRVAQALVGDPDVLLCDEPLLSLDLAHQRVVSELIDARRRSAGTAVLFVTHEINPALPAVDRVLYLAGGRFRIGTPDEVMTSATLSELYGTDVDVIRVRDRLLVIGAPDEHHLHHIEEQQ